MSAALIAPVLSALVETPPAISTRPLSRSVAVWRSGTLVMDPVASDNRPVLVLRISAEFRRLRPVVPPATTMVPSGSKVAVWSARGVLRAPMVVKVLGRRGR